MAQNNVNNHSFRFIQDGISNILSKTVAGKARAILFGSRARGDAGNNSDWDILILISKEKVTLQDIDAILYPIREFGWDINEIINPILFTEQEWQAKAFTPFFKNVTNEGIYLCN